MSNPNTRKPVAILSIAGGINIEETAGKHMVSFDIDIFRGFRPYDARNLARKLKLEGKEPVSYTHLDVYKRQGYTILPWFNSNTRTISMRISLYRGCIPLKNRGWLSLVAMG